MAIDSMIDSDSPDDDLYRIVLIGDSYVGKTALINHYITNSISSNYEATIGAAFHAFPMTVHDDNIMIQVWDTAGQERYRSLGPVYYRNASGALLVYDITERKTFDSILTWIKIFRDNAGPNVPVFLVGNKIDLEDSTTISLNEQQDLAQALGLPTGFRTSALNGTGVSCIFETVAEILYQDHHPSEQPNGAIDVGASHEEVSKKSCC